ncbi:MAG: hypothetical protein QXD03_03895 [Candidatus Anstonellales archaeon]
MSKVIKIYVVLLISKVLGLMREYYIIKLPIDVADSYNIYMIVPYIVMNVMSVIEVGYYKVCSKSMDKKVITDVLLSTSVIIIFIVEWVLVLIGVGFTGYLLISVLSIGLIVIQSELNSYIKLNGALVVCSLNGVVYNVVLLVMIFLARVYSMVLMYSILLVPLLQLFMSVYYIRKLGYDFTFRLDTFIIREIANSIGIQFIIFMSFQVNVLMDKLFVTSIYGGITVLNYSTKVIYALRSLIEPILQMYVIDLVNNRRSKYTRLVWLSVIGLSVICLLVGDIMKLIQIDSINVINTTRVYILVLIFNIVVDVLSKHLYIKGEGLYISRLAFMSVFINFVLDYILVKDFGVQGVGIASLVVYVLLFICLVVRYRVRVRSNDYTFTYNS